MRRFRAALTGACTTLANTRSRHPTLYCTPASPYLHFSYTIHTVSFVHEWLSICGGGCLGSWLDLCRYVGRSFLLSGCVLPYVFQTQGTTDRLTQTHRVDKRVYKRPCLHTCSTSMFMHVLPRSRLSIALSMCMYVRVCINTAADFAQDLYSLYRHDLLRSIRCKNC